MIRQKEKLNPHKGPALTLHLDQEETLTCDLKEKTNSEPQMLFGRLFQRSTSM